MRRSLSGAALVLAAVAGLAGCATQHPVDTAQTDPSTQIGDFGPGAPSFLPASPGRTAVPSGAASGRLTVPAAPRVTRSITAPAGVPLPVTGPRGSVRTPSRPGTAPASVTNPLIAPSMAPQGPPVLAQALTAADVGGGAQALVGPSDSAVTGTSSLGLCNGSFPSEAKRIARRHTTFSDAQGRTLATNEVVRYSAGAAAQAFSEVSAAVTTCPTTGLGAAAEAKPPAALGGSALELRVDLSTKGNPLFVVTVYQRVGDTLGITTVYRNDADAAQAEAERLGKIEAGRLTAS